MHDISTSLKGAGIPVLSLKSFHLVLIMLSIVLSAGASVWTLMHGHPWIGVLFSAVGILLIAYLGYFAGTIEQKRLEE